MSMGVHYKKTVYFKLPIIETSRTFFGTRAYTLSFIKTQYFLRTDNSRYTEEQQSIAIFGSRSIKSIRRIKYYTVYSGRENSFLSLHNKVLAPSRSAESRTGRRRFLLSPGALSPVLFPSNLCVCDISEKRTPTRK